MILNYHRRDEVSLYGTPVRDSQFSITNSQLPMLNYQFSITREEVSLYGTPICDFQFSITNSPITNAQLPILNYQGGGEPVWDSKRGGSTCQQHLQVSWNPLSVKRISFPFLSFEKQSRKGLILRLNWAAQRNLILLLSSLSILFKSDWCSCDTNLTL